MRSALFAGALIAVASSAAYAQGDTSTATRVSEAECGSLWREASPNGSPISESQAADYLTNFKAANPDGDTTIEQDEFSRACESGLVKSAASTGASTGEAGSANSPETLHPPTNRVGEQVPTMRADENVPDAKGSTTYQPGK